MAMAVNPYQKYKQQSIMTMTQGEMLLKLYAETITQLMGGMACIEKKDYAQANKAMQKAQRILLHLKATLDFQYEISNNLSMLYDFFIQKIVEANISKTTAPVEEVLPMIEQLRDSFEQADKLARAGAAH